MKTNVAETVPPLCVEERNSLNIFYISHHVLMCVPQRKAQF